MSTLVAGAVVATAMLSNCSWNHPGRNPYRGNATEAVSRYIDIPAPVRTELIAKIKGGQADDTVAIKRDSIAGKYDYSPQLTDMHFGRRTVCGNVTRNEWTAVRSEPAKVYCAGNHCLIVPRICGNISRVRRIAGEGSGGGIGAAAAPGGVAMARAETPGMVRAASPDEVAAADTMAEMVAGSPTTEMSPGFMSPFDGTSRAPGSSGNPATDTGLVQPGPFPAPVPEPSTLAMLGAGLAVVLGVARRRARSGRTVRA